MKAIQTIYKGRRFRSRLEARWAIFFDSINIGWEYETEGFELGDTKYLTDFRLQSFGANKVDLYIEIKPNKPSIEEIEKCFKVAAGTSTSVALICGTPGIPEFSTLGEDWNLKNGYIVLYFPSDISIKKDIEETPFDIWALSNRFSLFQTDSKGEHLDIWPIYWDIKEKDDMISYQMLRGIENGIEDVYGVNTFGSSLPSLYMSMKNTGRYLDHERLIYGYQLSTCARFEFDEFNLEIIDDFYRELELIPFKKVYSDSKNCFALYYHTLSKKFIAKESSEVKPEGVITLIKKAPKLVIKQFVINFPKKLRTEDTSRVIEHWKGFLFRHRIRQKDLKLKRVI
jgi:hypothetical protein